MTVIFAMEMYPLRRCKNSSGFEGVLDERDKEKGRVKGGSSVINPRDVGGGAGGNSGCGSNENSLITRETEFIFGLVKVKLMMKHQKRY